MNTAKDQVIAVVHLFPRLDDKLLELLRGLTSDEWHLPTIAKLWRVKDIASHLLDGNIKTLSFSRDHYFEPPAEIIKTSQDLKSYINRVNADWVKATARISPSLLIELLESTGRAFSEYMNKADLLSKAIFPVSWAGEIESVNWFHIAREYTEKWLHQQQIRMAVGKEGIMTREFYYPLIDTLMRGLPFTYKDIEAPIHTIIKVNISTEIGGHWFLYKSEKGWQLLKECDEEASSEITIDPQTAWKLFSKGIHPEEARISVRIKGNIALAEVALQMISVVA